MHGPKGTAAGHGLLIKDYKNDCRGCGGNGGVLGLLGMSIEFCKIEKGLVMSLEGEIKTKKLPTHNTINLA